MKPIAVLVAAALAVLPVAAAAEDPDIFHATLAEEGQPGPNISFHAMAQALKSGSHVIFDVRSYQEYAIGHIPGARIVGQDPKATHEAYVADYDQILASVNGDKTTPIITYCNGPFCGKSKRIAKQLIEKGFTDVSRFQLGDPVWRALGGRMEMEVEGLVHVLEHDATAVYVDVREPDAFKAQTIAGAINIPASQIDKGRKSQVILDAKENDRLPMEDHNTRLIVFGDDMDEIGRVSDALRHNAFHNVLDFNGTFEDIKGAAPADKLS